MSLVAVQMKVMPESADTDMGVLKEKIINNMPKSAKLNGEIEEEPIAFGLKALIVTVLVEDDEGGVESVEEAINAIPEAESIQIITMTRI
ncbi:MAG: elongation factor 1-beta [Methanosarcinaceae archaeon]|nr:elongation factor 1-beta [Methanosarcinaceae archaeon]